MTDTATTVPAPTSGHLLTVAKGPDWFPDQPDWTGHITCVAPERCNGWETCSLPHEVDGVSADAGPWRADDDVAWFEEEEFTFHGEPHIWQYGWGWTVPFPGCVVADQDSVSDAVYAFGQTHGEGTYVVDDEWDDPGDLTLLYVGRVDDPAPERAS